MSDSGFEVSYSGLLEAAKQSDETSIIRAVPIQEFDEIDFVAEDLGLDVDYANLAAGDVTSWQVPILLEVTDQFKTGLHGDEQGYLLASVMRDRLTETSSESWASSSRAPWFIEEGSAGIATVKVITDDSLLWPVAMVKLGDYLVSNGYQGDTPIAPGLTPENFPNGIAHMRMMHWWNIESSVLSECVVVSETECVDLDEFIELLE